MLVRPTALLWFHQYALYQGLLCLNRQIIKSPLPSCIMVLRHPVICMWISSVNRFLSPEKWSFLCICLNFIPTTPVFIAMLRLNLIVIDFLFLPPEWDGPRLNAVWGNALICPHLIFNKNALINKHVYSLVVFVDPKSVLFQIVPKLQIWSVTKVGSVKFNSCRNKNEKILPENLSILLPQVSVA